ncbi:alpha/beta fold hydrolase [Streptomyces sp. NPDC001941]|uniref:thioesterase II family protein n=1 Tax=Streptomyces sp. NPDC001941 TaxID=3154659 RepID=UPI00332AAA09
MSEERPVRLHCFAHAGAGVSAYFGWPNHLGPGVEQSAHLLPGREGRRREPRLTDRQGLLDDLLHKVATGPGGPHEPYVLYGHSLGALVAYTLTRALHEAGLPGPALLALGASPPPDRSSSLSDACRESDELLMSLLDEADALPEGAAVGGFWHRAVMPVLRDDLILADELRKAAREPLQGPPLDVPVLLVAGRDDPLAQLEAMAGWRSWTTGPVVARTVPGDHFFVRGRELPRLIGRACRVVGRLAADRAPAAARG